MSSSNSNNSANIQQQQHSDWAIAENWCETQVNIVKFNYTWTINHFSFRCEETGEKLESSNFSAGPNDKLEWCLWIYPKGDVEESKDYVSLFLVLVQCNEKEVWAKFKISILNAEGKETMATESQEADQFVVQGITDQFVHCRCLGWRKFIRRDFLLNRQNGLLPDDRLSIFCEVSVVGDTINVPGQNIQVPPRQLSMDMGSIFERSLFADCVLSAGCKEFKVHKNVLAGRSPVFAAMFEHGMTESQNGRVDIEDISPEVLEEMLRFMYTESAPNLEGMADGLLAAADKYQLGRLKAICEKTLCLSLTIEKACATLILAELHSAEHLKTQTVKHIILHANEVMESDGWKILEKGHPLLLAQLFKTLTKQKTAENCE